jgi:hypothetical protein
MGTFAVSERNAAGIGAVLTLWASEDASAVPYGSCASGQCSVFSDGQVGVESFGRSLISRPPSVSEVS